MLQTSTDKSEPYLVRDGQELGWGLHMAPGSLATHSGFYTLQHTPHQAIVNRIRP